VLQVTQDLAHFWKTGYTQVKKEMKGRYPRHPWPDDPTLALATAKTNRALRKG
jgi:ATP-dependent helicase HrpB